MNEQQELELEIGKDVLGLIVIDIERGRESLINVLENSNELISFFQNYMSDRWEVDNVFIRDVIFDEDKIEGSIEAVCGISLYHGCKDLNASDEYTADLLFQIDFEKSLIIISGEPIPEPRTTYEEF